MKIDTISSRNLILILNDCRSVMHLSVLELFPVQKPLRLTSGLLMQAATMGLYIWYVCRILYEISIECFGMGAKMFSKSKKNTLLEKKHYPKMKLV